MEDNQTLLMLVLKQHYRERPKILDDALQVIKDYSSKECNEQEYDKTLHVLQEMMNDLPANILLYFLTMVPLPKQEHAKSTLLDIIKKSQHPICDNIRPVLVEYLNRNIPPLVPIEKKVETVKKPEPVEEILLEDLQDSDLDEKNKDTVLLEDEIKDPDFVKPSKAIKPRQKKPLTKGKVINCKSLLDLCTQYIVKNQYDLQKTYKKMKDMAWKMVYDNVFKGNELNMCYDVIRDMNKKEKWLRAIENEDITHEILAEVYGESDIFIQERNLAEYLNEDPFVVSPILANALTFYVENC